MAEQEKQINMAFEALLQLRDRHPEAYALLGSGLRYAVANYEQPHDPATGQTHAQWRAAAGLEQVTSIRTLPDVCAGMKPHDGLTILAIFKWLHPTAWHRLDDRLQDLVCKYAARRAIGQVER